MTSFVLFGNTDESSFIMGQMPYAQIIRDGRGRILALYPLLPDRMTVGFDKLMGGFYYEYRKDTGYVILRPEDILHIPGLALDGLVGYSPIAMAKERHRHGHRHRRIRSKFFANGGQPRRSLDIPV